MEMIQSSKRIHPMLVGAAASVMLVSLLGAAAITGILPSSRGTSTEAAPTAAISAETLPDMTSNQQAATTPAVIKEVGERKTVVHHQHAQHQVDSSRARPAQVAQAEPARQHFPAPAYQQQAQQTAQQPTQQPTPVAQNSPLGIGIGAVVGGLLGSKVGGGNGRTLAAIAGAVGGGYVGNEIAKRNQ